MRIGDKNIEHVGGLNWYEAGIEFRDRAWWRRIFHTHRPQTRVWWDNGDYLERCPCGAYGFGGNHWRKRL